MKKISQFSYIDLEMDLMAPELEEKARALKTRGIRSFHDFDGVPENRMAVQFFSYRSLLLFKLARGMPLPPSLAMLFSRCIVESLMIVAISHSDYPGNERWISLEQRPAKGEFLRIHSERKKQEKWLRNNNYLKYSLN